MTTRKETKLFDEIALELNGNEVMFATHDQFQTLAARGVLSEMFYKHAMAAAQLAQKEFENDTPSKQEITQARMDNEDLISYKTEDVPAHIGSGTLVFYKVHNRRVTPELN